MLEHVDLFESPSPDKPKSLSVTQLVRRMKNLLEIQIGEQWVEGEVSNLSKQRSGHWYFSLKDDRAQISCAMFSAQRRAGSDVLANGAKIRVFAEPGIYEARGQLQIIVAKAEAAGRGALQEKFEALKRKLDAEGLFAPERKRALPSFPQTIGLITSGTGAAIRDMVHVFERRAPWVQLVLYPVRVQGKGAEREIVRAIEHLGQPESHHLPACDLLIIGRGGGSLEDLWNFNEEAVARAIAACPLPIISAVGHEIDFTIADFVADQRAATPSAAAEIAVPAREDLAQRLQALANRMQRHVAGAIRYHTQTLDALQRGILSSRGERLLREPTLRLDSLSSRLKTTATTRINQRTQKLDQLARRLETLQPARQLERRQQSLHDLQQRLSRTAQSAWRARADHLTRLGDLLRALGPESAFERGFSITTDDDGRIVRSTTSLRQDQLMHTRFKDGIVASRVTSADPATQETPDDQPPA